MYTEPRNSVPRHVAIIMDGNGRWAEARGMDRIHGHLNGVESIRRTITAALRSGVEYLTLYAFSTENWGRPEKEVDALMEILCDCTVRETPELKAQGVRIRFMGGIDTMSEQVRASIARSEKDTADCSKLTLVLAVNYSGRWELVRMAQQLAEEARAGSIDPQAITAETVAGHLATAGIPDPDLLVRTSGEVRLSNFLLWQLAYSELYFTPVLWPDFDEAEFDKAIAAYGQRERRYGTLTTQPKS